MDEKPYERLFRAVERAYRLGESSDLRIHEVDLARIVAPPSRGNLFVVSRDSLRSPGVLKRLMRDDDLVVTSHGKPFAVLMSLEEYERLTGREPKPPEI